MKETLIEEIQNSKDGDISPKYMRAKALAKHLSIGVSTVWLYAKQGKLTAKKVSPRVTLFDVKEAEKALLLEVV
ncbi:MAG: DNA-binding protein [Campylobacterota bacterium]|nr:DNA-binding protein [Campylobacterota bacterium]